MTGRMTPGLWSRVAPRAVHRVPLSLQKASPCVAFAQGWRAAVAGVSLRQDGAAGTPPSHCRGHGRGGGTEGAGGAHTMPCRAKLSRCRALPYHSTQQGWAALGWAVPCRATPGWAVPRRTTPRHTGLCRAMLDCTGQCLLCQTIRTVPCRVGCRTDVDPAVPAPCFAGPAPGHAVLCHAVAGCSSPVPCCGMPCHARPCHSGLYHARKTVPVLGCHILCCASPMPCCPVLCHAVLGCTEPGRLCQASASPVPCQTLL